MQGRSTVLDLFCGAGGLSLGFAAAGFEIVQAIDHDVDAIATYRANIGAHATVADVSRCSTFPAAEVLIGGPPCQGFSSAGMRKLGDSRNTLVALFAHIVATLRPTAFIFENVEGFLTAEHGAYVLDLLSPLIAVGYRIHVRKVNAANYGVPQHRKRVIAIGGLGWEPSFPLPTHTAHGAPGATLATRLMPRTPSLGEALMGLPQPSLREPGDPQGHFYAPPSGLDLSRMRGLSPGQRMRDLPEELWHDSYRRRAFRRVQDGTPTERRGGAPSGVRRLIAEQPSKAITGGARAEFVHPYEDRNLTLRELARIQTFPDDFTFLGTLTKQEQLIGNAVPPLLATRLAQHLEADLRRASPPRCATTGALLSFVPTLSSGMSPALAAVVHRVSAACGLGSTHGDPLSEAVHQLPLWV